MSFERDYALNSRDKYRVQHSTRHYLLLEIMLLSPCTGLEAIVVIPQEDVLTVR